MEEPFNFDASDYTVAVKNRARPPKPWKWEIYRAGRRSPVEQSTESFESMGAATRAGKLALERFVAKLAA
jgi:hypothetical protein